jgi:hypothetical protein
MNRFHSSIIRRRLVVVVLILAGGPQQIFANRRFACFMVRPGETASQLALRLTGNALNQHAQWFQIVDPLTSRVIPKSQYGRIVPDWQACIVPPENAYVPPAKITVGWWWLPLFLLMPAIWFAGAYVERRETTRLLLSGFGNNFIREFEQSVIQESSGKPGVRSRLRGLLYLLWDLSQIDPSDLSSLFAGPGRLRMGFSEIDPPSGGEPSDEQLERAVRGCWENPFCCFKGPVGTSLICIHGEWSNIADARIKSRLAALAAGTGQNLYDPLYARAFHMPKPWGITALFAEHTGNHAPVDIDLAVATESAATERPANDLVAVVRHMETPGPPAAIIDETKSFSSFREFALALNRADPCALGLAQDGDKCALSIDEHEVRKLLGTFWFRSMFARLSPTWRERVLTVLSERIVMPNHVLRLGRQDVRVSELNHAQLKELSSKIFLPDAVQADLHLLIAIGNLWGQEGLDRVRFSEQPPIDRSAKGPGFFQGFRKSES